MAPIMARLAFVLLSAATVTAHFTIDYPPSIEAGDEDKLSSGPCGGATIDFSKGPVTDFHVGGDAIALSPTHPQSKWLFRATTDEGGNGGWVSLFPIIEQAGLGRLCEPELVAPSDFVGKKGIVSAVAKAEDGILYGCALVNFVEGKGSTPSECRNTTSEINFSSDGDLSALVSGGSSPPPSGSQSPSGSSNGGPAPTGSPGVAATIQPGSGGVVGMFVVATVAMLAGMALTL